MQLFKNLLHDKRKRKVVDFFLQMQISTEILLLSLTLFVLMMFVLYVPPFATLFSSKDLDTHQNAIGWLLEINLDKWPIFIVLVVLWVFVTILFSHRIVGPYYKFMIMFRRYADRDLRVQTYLREHDYFKPLVPLVNKVIENTEEDVHSLKQEFRDLTDLAEKLPEGSHKTELLERLRRTTEQLDHYQLNEQEEANVECAVSKEASGAA